MGETREKVVVAMSGGVDSSVAAALLVERGYEVIGLFMRHGVKAGSPSGPSASDEAGSLSGSSSPTSATDFARTGKPAVCGVSTAPIAARPLGGTPLPLAIESRPARSHQGCCSATDAADARFVAGMLGIPFYALNFERDFHELIDHFSAEYARGRTPNPCVVCNDKLKFGRLFEYADAVGARYVATGHYARVEHDACGSRLHRARDARKDQSYVLFGMRRDALTRTLFPIGDMSKDEVRAFAAARGFPNCDKPDSVEICFVPDRDYARVVRERHPEAFVEGDVLDATGRVIGRHRGLPNYTIGQRRGLGIATGAPAYVTRINRSDNTVVLGDGDALLSESLRAERVNMLADMPASEFRAAIKIRYLHEPVMGAVRLLAGPLTSLPEPRASARANVTDSNTLAKPFIASGSERMTTVDVVAEVHFDVPQRAVTPGQAVVFYDGDRVLGGGWIAEAVGPQRG